MQPIKADDVDETYIYRGFIVKRNAMNNGWIGIPVVSTPIETLKDRSAKVVMDYINEYWDSIKELEYLMIQLRSSNERNFYGAD